MPSWLAPTAIDDDPVHLRPARREHHYRRVATAAQFAAYVAAVDVREVQVEQDEVRRHPLGQAERFRPAVRDDRLEPRAGQGLRERVRYRRLVLDEQDARVRHGVTVGARNALTQG